MSSSSYETSTLLLLDQLSVDLTPADQMANFTTEEQLILFPRSLWTIILATILGMLILITLIGNIFVVFAIMTDRDLKRIGNYLILSLAVADFLVALTVMPIGAITEVAGEWVLGSFWCEVWTSADVFCCAASILHLVAIALDRYWTVTQVNYIHQRNAKSILKMLICIWSLATFVSVAPLFGWKDENFERRIEEEKICIPSQDVVYQVFATCSTFYAPLVVILFLYWRVFKVARKRIRHKPGKAVQLTEVRRTEKAERDAIHRSSSRSEGAVAPNRLNKKAQEPGMMSSSPDLVVTGDPITKGCSSESAPINSDGRSSADSQDTTKTNTNNTTQVLNCEGLKVDDSYREIAEQDSGDSIETVRIAPATANSALLSKQQRHANGRSTRESLEAKRERKAAKTLAIITGVFVICWLPFFIIALLMPLCGHLSPICDPPKVVFSIFLWLGYVNSTLNPIIYTIFSPDFRSAFKRILLGRTASRSPCRV